MSATHGTTNYELTPASMPRGNITIIIIRLGPNVPLTHQNRSYRDSETKENVEAQKRKQIGGNVRKRTAT